MKKYFASVSTIRTLKGAGEISNFLETYHFLKNKNLIEWKKQIEMLDSHSFFLDSGAFSAFTKGEEIDLDAYIKYIHLYKNSIDVYAGLDVIGDWKKSARNIAYMESHGLEPIPTFHYGSPLKELVRLATKYEYIALGGLVPIAGKPEFYKWLDKCFVVIFNTKKNLKVHGFGVASIEAWKRYPFYSVDATSWLTAGMYRRYKIFTEKGGGSFTTYSKFDKELGIDKMQLTNHHYRDLFIKSAGEYQKAANFVTKVWEARGIKYSI